MDFPSIIPVFPLPNVVLFPGVPLPLHIFEPRYRDMVREASEGHEIIGMVLLRGDWQPRYHEKPEIFDTGCAGKIVNVESLPDGRYNILLHGLREFTIRRHVFEKSYRQGEVSWRSTTYGGLDSSCRAALINLLSQFLHAKAATPANRLLRDRSLRQAYIYVLFYGQKPLTWLLEGRPVRNPAVGYSAFNTYEFRSVDWEKDLQRPSTLIIAPFEQLPNGVSPREKIKDLQGSPVISLISIP